jgi:hypothetical protein
LTGDELWSTSHLDTIPISDPFLADGELAVIVIAPEHAVDIPIFLQILDPESGQCRRQHQLLRVRQAWQDRSCCQVLAENDFFYAHLGGVLFRSTFSGHIDWIRTSNTIAPDDTAAWLKKVHQPPLATTDLLIVSQVGVAGIDAVDRNTGRLRWHAPIPGVHKILGISNHQVIVKHDRGLTSLAVNTGHVVWEHASSSLLDMARCLPNGKVIYSRATPLTASDASSRMVQLIVVEAASGKRLREFSLPELVGSNPNVGPLVVTPRQTWLFFSAGILRGQRDLIVLQPNGIRQ